jgi:hypothetical protein
MLQTILGLNMLIHKLFLVWFAKAMHKGQVSYENAFKAGFKAGQESK